MMTDRHLRGLAQLAALIAAAGALSVVRAEPASKPAAAAQVDPAEAEGIIFERQQIMLQLEKDSEQLGLIVAGLAPRDKLAETARAVARGAKEAQASFTTPVPGGRSRPEVWSSHEDYSRRMQEFVQRSEAMAAMAEAGNFNGVIEVINDAMPCKACHDIYRAPKRSS